MDFSLLTSKHCRSVFVYIWLTVKLLTNNKQEKTLKLANAVIAREAALNK